MASIAGKPSVSPSAAGDRGRVIQGIWEERWHPLREEWVIIAAHRQSRPWTGASVDGDAVPVEPPYVADCYLCPGNARVNGARNDPYTGIFVFDNDLPCVAEDAPHEIGSAAGRAVSQSAGRGQGPRRLLQSAPQHDAGRVAAPTKFARCWNAGNSNTASWATGRKSITC